MPVRVYGGSDPPDAGAIQLVLDLLRRGTLAVTDSLPQYFDGVPKDKRSITLHQLLTHTSGISDLENAGDFDPIERDEFMRRILAQPLSSPPGTKYEYSNAGYSILGAIIEKLTGASYETFVRERLFLPQQMKDTGELPRIKTIVSALTNGDPAPLADAYNHRVTPEVIQNAWTDRVHEWESAHGKLTGFDVIGTAMLRERDMTLVRFNFERGNEWRAYAWDKDAEHRLLGSSARDLAPDVHCVPVPGGGFMSWDPRSGDSRPFAFETASKPTTLRISAGDQVFDARRDPPTR